MARLGRAYPASASIRHAGPIVGPAVIPPTNPGAPFRQDVFGTGSYVLLEAAFGADLTASPSTWTWYDITLDVMAADGLNVTWGRSDETSQSQPASFSCSLLNLSKAYSAYTATGIYGNAVQRNVPIRQSRDTGDGHGLVVEFAGTAIGWKPTWDTTGRLPIVQLSAAGWLRMLGQPRAPLASPLYRSIFQNAATFGLTIGQYWPGEEGSGATFSANAVAASTRSNLRLTSGTATWGQSTPPAGSAGCIDISSASSQLQGLLNVALGGLGWELVFAFRATAGAAGFKRPLASWQMSGGLRLDVWISDGTSSMNTLTWTLANSDFSASQQCGTTTVPTADGNWHWASFSLFSGGGSTVRSAVILDNVTVDSRTFTVGGLALGGLSGYLTIGFSSGSPFQVSPTSVGDLQVCHIAASNEREFLGVLAGPALNGHTGEDPVTRMNRLLTEEGVSFVTGGTSDLAMGPQLIDTLIANLRDCENTDGGMLYDGFLPIGVNYQARSERYNMTAAITVDASAGQLTPDFEPADDDQRTVNTFTASRNGGGSATVTDVRSPLSVLPWPNGIGVAYPQSGNYNLADDGRLAGIAGWRVRGGTFYGFRYPTLQANWIQPQLVLTTHFWRGQLKTFQPLGFRIDVTNPAIAALGHPVDTVSGVVEGATVTSDQFSWRATLNCSPFLPNLVAVEGPGVHRNVDAFDSEVASPGVSSGATTLPVTNVTTFRPWTNSTDHPADFPFYIVVNTEVMQVTAASKVTVPNQSLTVVRSINGVVLAHVAGEAVRLYQPGAVAL